MFDSSKSSVYNYLSANHMPTWFVRLDSKTKWCVEGYHVSTEASDKHFFKYK